MRKESKEIAFDEWTCEFKEENSEKIKYLIWVG